MSEILYCIDHERLEFVQNSPVGMCHEYAVRTEFGTEVDWCFFDLGWAYYSPPEDYPDWDLDTREVVEEDNFVMPLDLEEHFSLLPMEM